MQKAYVVRGRVSDSRHVELEEPIGELGREVQVLILTTDPKESREDVLDFILKLKPGSRTKEDIDQQINDERDQWDDK